MIKKVYNWIKQKLRWLLVGGVALAGTGAAINGIPPQAPPITLENGQVITFEHIDSYFGENIAIYTDRAVYDQSISEAEVYFAIIAPETQRIDMKILTNNRNVKEFEWLVPTTERIETPVYEQKCVTEKLVRKEVTRTAIRDTKGTTTQESKPQEVCEDVLVRTDVEVKEYYTPQKLEKKRIVNDGRKMRKDLSGPADIRRAWEEKKITEELKYTTQYGRMVIAFDPSAKNEQFLIEVNGEKGDYGLLDPWFDNDWNYRQKITVESSEVAGSGSHSNFPVYVDLSDMSSGFFTNVKSDGCDIRVVESDEETETPFELVDIDTSGGTGELHFLADSLSTSADTEFYIYYGNSGASCYAEDATYGAENVWSDYDIVYHFTESAGSSEDAVDRTGNGWDASPTNVSDTTGTYMGDAWSFNGSNAIASISSSYRFGATHTISLYGKAGASNSSFFTYGYGNIQGNKFFVLANAVSGTAGYFRHTINGYSASYQDHIYYGGTYGFPTDDSYAKLSIIVAENDQRVYVDGNESSSATDANTLDDITTINFVVLGARSYNSTITYGDVDISEFRIANVARSADWEVAEYNNQSDVGTFLTIGTEESNGAPPAPRRIIITQ
jgi:hypothetical protein